MFAHACIRSRFDPGADKVNFGFHSSDVGKMRSDYYVAELPLQKTAGLRNAAASWLRVDKVSK